MEEDVEKFNKEEKEKILKKINEHILSNAISTTSINADKKKIVTYENLLRFYQNAMETFALESHRHFAQDVVTDKNNRFVTDEQIEQIKRFAETATATDEQIEALFNEK